MRWKAIRWRLAPTPLTCRTSFSASLVGFCRAVAGGTATASVTTAAVAREPMRRIVRTRDMCGSSRRSPALLPTFMTDATQPGGTDKVKVDPAAQSPTGRSPVAVVPETQEMLDFLLHPRHHR